jgi:hypothetical protein
MTGNTAPKFWFEVDGRQYGARFLTIGEQTQVQVEVERLTNGKFSEWMGSDNDVVANAAVLTQVAVSLNKVVVAWPTDVPAVDFLESDDPEFALKLWEGYGKAAQTFRGQPASRGAGQGVVQAAPAPPVVPGPLQDPAE